MKRLSSAADNSNTSIGFFGTAPISKPSGNLLTAASSLGLVTSPSLAESDVTGLTTDLAAKLNLDGSNSMTADLTIEGSSNRIMSVARAGSGVGKSLTIRPGGSASGSTDTTAGDLVLSSGVTTGSVRSGIKFALTAQGSAGTTDNNPANLAAIFTTSTVSPVLSLGTTTLSATGLPLSANAFALTGQLAGGLTMYRNTTSNTAGSNLTVQASGATSLATDKAGGTLALNAGISTGTGTGTVTIGTPTPAGSTGTGDNSPTARVTVDSSQVNIQHGFRTKRTTVADAAYTILLTDHIIAYTSISAARAITLPSASTAGAGAEVIVKDESGSCSVTNTITVTGTIDGATNKVLNSAYAVGRYYSNGTNWFSC